MRIASIWEVPLLGICLCCLSHPLAAQTKNPSASELPQVPDGFAVSVFAREPLVYKPTATCFDAKGRLLVGQGPQYPRNLENTPTDSVILLIDEDGEPNLARLSQTFGGMIQEVLADR